MAKIAKSLDFMIQRPGDSLVGVNDGSSDCTYLKMLPQGRRDGRARRKEDQDRRPVLTYHLKAVLLCVSLVSVGMVALAQWWQAARSSNPPTYSPPSEYVVPRPSG